MQSRNKLLRPVSGTKDDFNLEATLAENSRAKVQAKSKGCVNATLCVHFTVQISLSQSACIFACVEVRYIHGQYL